MKEPVTAFDFNAAFKALNELDYPKVSRFNKRRENLNEVFTRKQNSETLIEEYYDIASGDDLAAAKEARSNDVAKAKLARIEKIIDLDADTAEDLLPSYVGKFIIQCPQCMTLFYKDEQDIVHDDADPDSVNIGEVCQHCGNDSGYTLVGKVGEVTEDEMDNYNTDEADLSLDKSDLEAPVEDEVNAGPAEDTATDETPTEDELSLEEIPEEELDKEEDTDAEEKEEEDEKKESFNKPTGEALNESTGSDLSDPNLDIETSLHTPGIWGVEFVGDDVVLFNTEKEARAYFNSLSTRDISRDSESIELFVVTSKDGNTTTVDSINLYDEALKESTDPDLNKKLKDHNEYIATLQDEIKKEEDAVNKSKNEFIKKMHEANLESLKAALDAAIPDEVKAEVAVDNLPDADEIPDAAVEGKSAEEEVKESLKEGAEICPKCGKKICECNTQVNEAQCKINKFITHSEDELDELDEALSDDPVKDLRSIDWFSDLDDAGLKKVVAVYKNINAQDGKRIYDKDINAEAIKSFIDDIGGLGSFIIEGGKLDNGRFSIGHDERTSNDVVVDLAKKDKKFLKAVKEYVDQYNLLLFPEEAHEDRDYILAILDNDYDEDEVKTNMDEVGKIYLKTENVEDDDKGSDADAETLGDTSISNADIDKLFDSKEFDKPISDAEVDNIIDDIKEESFKLADIEDIDEDSLNEQLTKYFTEVYSNVKNFELAAGNIVDQQLVLEGTINFNSGKAKPTCFVFSAVDSSAKAPILEGLNKDLNTTKAFTIYCASNDCGKTLAIESLKYSYKINDTLVEGIIRK